MRVAVDPELGRDGFTYELKSGKQGTVNQDPDYQRALLLYKLTLEAQGTPRRISARGPSGGN